MEAYRGGYIYEDWNAAEKNDMQKESNQKVASWLSEK